MCLFLKLPLCPLQPGLPLSAVCEICKEPNQEETGDSSLTLMECSNCAQIVHPACLTVIHTQNQVLKLVPLHSAVHFSVIVFECLSSGGNIYALHSALTNSHNGIKIVVFMEYDTHIIITQTGTHYL